MRVQGALGLAGGAAGVKNKHRVIASDPGRRCGFRIAGRSDQLLVVAVSGRGKDQRCGGACTLGENASELGIFLRADQHGGLECPIVIKISPDIAEKEINNINEIISKFKIDGIILTNTTNQHRENLSDTKKYETGGLSGIPLQKISLKLIKQFFKFSKGKVPIIGVGGVDSGQSAFEKIAAGATAIQLYTGMVYNGPGVVKDIKKELIEILKKEKIKNIQKAIGINS